MTTALGLAVIYSLRRMGDSDLWHHLRCGEHLFHTGSILRTFAFNAGPAAAQPFLNHEWLFQALVYALEHAGGEPALMALQVGLVLATLAILYRTLRLHSSNLALVGLVMGLGIAASSHRLSLRPQHLTYLLLALLLHVLHLHERGRRRGVWALPALMLVWVNVHAECLWGLLIPAVFLFVEWLKARASGMPSGLAALARALALTAAATLVNPFGFKTAIWPLLVMREMWGGVEELLPPVTPRFAFFWAYCVLVALSVAWKPRRVDPTWAVLSAIFALIAWTANRGIPHFVLVSAPLVVACLDAGLGELRTPRALRLLAQAMPVAAMALLAALVVRSPAYLRPYDGVPYPEGAVRFLRAESLAGGVCSEHLWGGFLLWQGRPGLRPYIDGRFFARSAFEELAAVRAARPGWPAVLERNGITIALIGYASSAEPWLADALFASPSWWLVYWDDVSQLYLEDVPANAAAIERFGSRLINPDRQLLYQYAGVPPALAARAREVAERNAGLAPRSYRARIMAGNACLALGDAAAAAEHYEAALAVLDPPNAWIHYQIARCRLRLRELRAAEAHLEACLALAPDFAEGRSALVEVRRLRDRVPRRRRRRRSGRASCFVGCTGTPQGPDQVLTLVLS